MVTLVPKLVYQSGECEIDLDRRELRIGGVEVPLGRRTFEVIAVLAQANGEVVSKNQLIEVIWPGGIVEDNTLQVHISAVRKALGQYRGMLKTESGRGYRLVGTWTTRNQEAVAALVSPKQTPAPKRSFPTNIPSSASQLIGRADAVQHLVGLLANYRAVTLTGPGGIGKTALALEVMRTLKPSFEGSCWLVELASLSNPDLVPSAVAGVLDLELGGKSISAEVVARAIGAQKLILVLDNCEHVIDAVAGLAETILRFCPDTTVLATSREVLRIEGEYVYRVPPLDLPPEHQEEQNDFLKHSAVALLIARSRALDSGFEVREEDLSAIGKICRRLDGIPLAIEFAAARAATLGVTQVASLLEDRFGLLTGGRRTALARHQTLEATLDWSYELLPEKEKRLLRRLALFAGGFSLDAAVAVVGDTATWSSVADDISQLASKSLVGLSTTLAGRWRMLETIREYALRKLHQSREAEFAARRHAEFFRDLLISTRSEMQFQTSSENVAWFGREIDNIRAALDWSFSVSGDMALGVSLTAMASDFWIAVSLHAECRGWCTKALAHLGTSASLRDEMVLQCNLGLAIHFSQGMVPEVEISLSKALILSEALGDIDYQTRSLFGLWLFSRSVNFRMSLDFAQKFETLARTTTDAALTATANRMLGISRFYGGEYADAVANLQRAGDLYPPEMRGRDLVRFGADLQVSVLCYMGMSYWLLGFPDKAIRTGEEAIMEARCINHSVSLCIALATPASIVLVKMGDLDAAERHIEELIDHSQNRALNPYYALGLCAKGSLMGARGDLVSADRFLHHGLRRMREVGYHLFYALFLVDWSEILAFSDRVEQALVEIEAARRHVEQCEAMWIMPEVLRVKGEILARQNVVDAGVVEDHFIRALVMARGQGALTWELRAALSLARLKVKQARYNDAKQSLLPVYERFTEGFETTDFRAARAMLESIPPYQLTAD